MMDNSSIPFDERLLQAYLRTLYRIYWSVEDDLDVCIGAEHPTLDEKLMDLGYSSWLMITAWNPYSQLLSFEENIAKNQELLDLIKLQQLPYFPAQGIDPLGEWPPEDGWWIAGLDRDTAVAWGQLFEQNAVLWGKLAAAAELVICRS